MIDFARITVKAGDGGRGTGSFHKIKGKRYGKADGGHGGDGGNFYFEATVNLNTLEAYRFVKDYAAENGQMGLSRLRRGARGNDLILKVPIGTLIIIDSEVSGKLSYDLVYTGQKVLAARGGQGGRGNSALRDDFGRRPKFGEKGQVGEVCRLSLELKLIADIGLIGLPNAGKSTLLSKLNATKPEIGAYPFTTLEPNLGVLQVTGSAKRFILADIPGLIEGASEGKGLGDLFLKHIERTGLLVHLIDGSDPVSKTDQWETVREELKNYSKELIKKKEIVVITKIDLIKPAEVEKIKEEFKAKRKKVIAISCTTNEGLNELIGEIVKRLGTS